MLVGIEEIIRVLIKVLLRSIVAFSVVLVRWLENLREEPMSIVAVHDSSTEEGDYHTL